MAGDSTVSPIPNGTVLTPSQSGFEEELRSLLNKYGLDVITSTPDFILATSVVSYLTGLSILVRHREQWFGRKGDGTGRKYDGIGGKK